MLAKLRLLAALMLVVYLGGCTRHDAATLSDEHLVPIAEALRHPIAERPLHGNVGICLPGRSDPPARFLEKFDDGAFSLVPCPFWENSLLRKSQWVLDVYDVEVTNGTVVIRILGTEPSGLHGGHYFLKYDRSDDSWVLTEKIYGIP